MIFVKIVIRFLLFFQKKMSHVYDYLYILVISLFIGIKMLLFYLVRQRYPYSTCNMFTAKRLIEFHSSIVWKCTVVSNFKGKIKLLMPLDWYGYGRKHPIRRKTTWKNNTWIMSSSLEIWAIFNGAHLAAFPRITQIYVKGERAPGEYWAFMSTCFFLLILDLLADNLCHSCSITLLPTTLVPLS